MPKKQSASTGLANHFLIATPKLKDGIFDQSIVYICEHNTEGTMGLKINHSLPLKLEDMFLQLKISCHENLAQDTLLLDGGPINVQQGFILHDTKQQEWENCLQVSNQLFVTTSKDILYAIAEERLEGKFSVVLGYSGWSSGQLEDELKDNAWLTIPATQEALFNIDKTHIWQHCVDQLGFDLNQLSHMTGNA